MPTNKKPEEVTRDWWVFSTALEDVVLMLECRNTGAYGIVRNPTRKEWREAFYAPSKPYRWTQPERVEIVSEAGSSGIVPIQ